MDAQSNDKFALIVPGRSVATLREMYVVYGNTFNSMVSQSMTSFVSICHSSVGALASVTF